MPGAEPVGGAGRGAGRRVSGPVVHVTLWIINIMIGNQLLFNYYQDVRQMWQGRIRSGMPSPRAMLACRAGKRRETARVSAWIAHLLMP